MGPNKKKGKPKGGGYLLLGIVAVMLAAALPAIAVQERDVGPPASVVVADQAAPTLATLEVARATDTVAVVPASMPYASHSAIAGFAATPLPAERATLAERFGERGRWANFDDSYDLCVNALGEPASTDARTHRSHILRV